MTIHKLTFSDIVQRVPIPEPWQEGDNIPWNDPAFSARMLKEHLSQDHDAASRKFGKIERHIEWIHNHALEVKGARILDLGCGPGLYSTRLARLGHQVHGIDYSPASIKYAQETAQLESLECSFQEADIRLAEYGQGYDAVMLIYGEFNVFKPEDIQFILENAYQALKPGGVLILEPHTYEIIQEMGEQGPSWHSALSGVYSDQPYIVLHEYTWIVNQQVTNFRYYVIQADDGSVLQYAQSMQAYTQDEYQALLEKKGYTKIQFYPSLMGVVDPEQRALMAILARKPGASK